MASAECPRLGYRVRLKSYCRRGSIRACPVRCEALEVTSLHPPVLDWAYPELNRGWADRFSDKADNNSATGSTIGAT